MGSSKPAKRLAAPEPDSAQEAPAWRCRFGFSTCADEVGHTPHADLDAFARSGTFRLGDFETLLRLVSWQAVLEPLARRADLTGTQRVRVASMARTEPEWMAVLAWTELSVLRALASRSAPSVAAARCLVDALDGDHIALVSQLFIEHRMRRSGHPRADIHAILVESEFARVADAVLELPCPSGRWTPALVVATTRRLLKRLPSVDRGRVLETFLVLACEWEGTVADLVAVSDQL